MATIFSILIAIWVLQAAVDIAVGLLRILSGVLLSALSLILWAAAHLLESHCLLWQTAFEKE